MVGGKTFHGFADHVGGFAKIEVQRGICVRDHGPDLAMIALNANAANVFVRGRPIFYPGRSP